MLHFIVAVASISRNPVQQIIHSTGKCTLHSLLDVRSALPAVQTSLFVGNVRGRVTCPLTFRPLWLKSESERKSSDLEYVWFELTVGNPKSRNVCVCLQCRLLLVGVAVTENYVSTGHLWNGCFRRLSIFLAKSTGYVFS